MTTQSDSFSADLKALKIKSCMERIATKRAELAELQAKLKELTRDESAQYDCMDCLAQFGGEHLAGGDSCPDCGSPNVTRA